MKRFMSVVAAGVCTLAMSTSVFAHSHLGATSPADGETITEPLTQITLQFDGDIEQGSYIDVISSTGATIEANMSIDTGVLTGTFATPLSNDTYTVDWSIISADGHPLEGEYTFTVALPEDTQFNEPAPEEQQEVLEDSSESNDAAIEKEEDVTGPSGAMLAAVGVGILALLGGVFYFVTRKE